MRTANSRNVRIVVALAWFVSFTAGADQVADRFRETIDDLLDKQASTFGPEAKVLMRAGDRVAFVIRRDRDLGSLTPSQIRTVLYAVTSAFFLPEIITAQENRFPRLTMELLQDLRARAKNDGDRRRVDDAVAAITSSLAQFSAAQKTLTPPFCGLQFVVSSAEPISSHAYLVMDNPTSRLEIRTDDFGRIWWQLATGKTETYAFRAPGRRDVASTVTCYATEQIDREILLTVE